MIGRVENTCNLRVTAGQKGNIFNQDLSKVSEYNQDNFNLLNLNCPPNSKSLKLEFASGNSPLIYGVLLDGMTGIEVDNYSIRGHGGLGLLSLNDTFIKKQLKYLNTKLIIMQYGANVVPYYKNDEQCKNLEETYYNIFMKVKAQNNGASMLIIGLGDAARQVNGQYVSYPQIPKIRDAQKKAALRANCAFWDLYEVMGGNNSIINWTKKGLASYEGHLGDKGARIIINELYKFITQEYSNYKSRAPLAVN